MFSKKMNFDRNGNILIEHEINQPKRKTFRGIAKRTWYTSFRILYALAKDDDASSIPIG